MNKINSLYKLLFFKLPPYIINVIKYEQEIVIGLDVLKKVLEYFI